MSRHRPLRPAGADRCRGRLGLSRPGVPNHPKAAKKGRICLARAAARDYNPRRVREREQALVPNFTATHEFREGTNARCRATRRRATGRRIEVPMVRISDLYSLQEIDTELDSL